MTSAIVLGGAFVAALPGTAGAIEIDTGSSGWMTRLDTTVKYSLAVRTTDPKDRFLLDPNTDDSQRNFDKGSIISNRLDVLSEFDTQRNGWGFRASAAGWYDLVYNEDNDNRSALTFNPYTVQVGHFTDTTQRLHGANVELLDAFAFGTFDVFDRSLSFRAGRHTVIWGSSLFYTFNGIASGQAPVDFIKGTSVPNSLAKELFMPVTQVSATYSLAENLTVAGFYQLEWRRNRFPAADSFFSFGDQLDGGGERIIFAPGNPGAFVVRGEDNEPSDTNGQFGINLRYNADNYDLGLYALQYNAKSPILYMNSGVAGGPPGALGQYFLIFPEKIQALGVSIDTNIDIFNIAGEISFKHDNPLLAGGLPDVAAFPGYDARGDGLFARGNTLHYQISGTAVTAPNSFQDGGSIAFELAAERLISVSHGRDFLASNASRDGVGATVQYTANYYQVMPSLDLNLVLTGAYNFVGPGATGNFSRGGNISIGLNGIYDQVWNAGLSYTHYIAPSSSPESSNLGRNFFALTLRTTF